MARSPIFKKIQTVFSMSALASRHGLPVSEIIERREEQIFYSRRQILKLGIQAAASIPVTGIAQSVYPTLLARKKNPDDPIVIIGAGIAGLSTAYFLSNHDIPCVVYEASSRLGGRMFTQYNFAHQGMFVERGAEFVDTRNELLIALCREVGVTVQELFTGSTKDLKFDTFLDGKLMDENDLATKFLPLASEIIKDTKLFRNKGKAIVPTYRSQFNSVHLDRMSISEYLDSKKDIDPLIKKSINLLYLIENGMAADKQSALNMLTGISTDTDDGLAILGDSDQSKRIQGGSSALIERLSDILDSRGVEIHRDHPLLSIREKSSAVELVFGKEGSTKTVLAERVVCAIPLTVLRRIEGVKSLSISPQKKNYINELGYGTSSKISMGFKTKRWHKSDKGIPGFAQVVWDLPSQTIWDSSLNQQLAWETSTNEQKKRSGILTCFVCEDLGRNLSNQTVELVLQNLETIKPGIRLEFNGNKTLQNWNKMPWNQAAYSTPLVGQYTSFWGTGSITELNGRLIFAGEHTSDKFPGFMEGALESGVRVARLLIKDKKSSKVSA